MTTHTGSTEHRTPPAKGVYTMRVIDNASICRDHWRFTMEVDDFPPAAPGQFLQIQCSDPDDIGRAGGVMIRRPFSIAGLRRDGLTCELDVILARVGAGTRWLSLLRPGDRVSVLGPLGRPFTIRDDKPIAWLVGGGVGLPPLIWLAEELRNAGKTVVALAGARTEPMLPLTRRPGVAIEPDLAGEAFEEFARSGASVLLATDDGSLGTPGLVTEAFARFLDKAGDQAADAAVYTCGPEPMMQTTAGICLDRGIPCQVCLERTMACGMGTCQSCVVPLRDASADDGWRYGLCCSEGPVFDAAAVIWDL